MARPHDSPRIEYVNVVLDNVAEPATKRTNRTKNGDIVAGTQAKHEGCEILTCVGEKVPPKSPKLEQQPREGPEEAEDKSAGFNPANVPPTLPEDRVPPDIPDSPPSLSSLACPIEARRLAISSLSTVFGHKKHIRWKNPPIEASKDSSEKEMRHKRPPEIRDIPPASEKPLEMETDLAPGSVEDKKPPDIATVATPEARKSSLLYISHG